MPVPDVGLVPHFEPPALDFAAAVFLHEVPRQLIRELAPPGVVLRRIRPPGVDVVVVVARLPEMAIRLRMRRQRLRHESELHQRLHPALEVRVEDPIDDRPVVPRPARGVLGVRIRGSPLEGRHAVAAREQVVRAKVDLHSRTVADSAELRDQLPAVLHRGVVRLVGTEEAPDRVQLA